jgi:Flp pilus assembly secretin CpaC
MFSLNRVVAVLTPLVFAPAAAATTAWIATHFPGLPTIDPGQVVAVEIAGATAALGTGLTWLHGHQKWNSIVADLVRLNKLDAAINAGFVKGTVHPVAVPDLSAPSTEIADVTLPGEPVAAPAGPADGHA